MIIKICLFFQSFCIYYAINALFFTGITIHKIYKDGGCYNFIYFLPHIIFSFFISYIISKLIKNIFLSERNILQIKKENLLEKAHNLASKVKRILIIKYILYFVIGMIFLIFLWYYLSSFGAV